ncbi:hypothetical protein G7Z17_g7578 [Cylindrodendrum hubeiense]|uniref:Cytochrome P450 n=1 Tax=Cylindrodendrum hubeiense TaxID=595255 RepID=A0A9P5H3G4_9HYPO|nr:hypothetical protein G7Z17_g7578 [Cylindrodendrum hubeiense]
MRTHTRKRSSLGGGRQTATAEPAIIARSRFLKFVVRCVRERVERSKLKTKGMGISEHSISEGAGGDVFESLDTAKDSKTKEGLKLEELRSESITLIVAESETSSIAIASMFFHIAGNTAVYDLVASEVIAPGGLLVDSSLIGTGCNTVVGIYAIHHDARYYADLFVYRPERWLEDDGSGESIERARFAFTPFSLGIRACIGKSLAYHEIAATIGLSCVVEIFVSRTENCTRLDGVSREPPMVDIVRMSISCASTSQVRRLVLGFSLRPVQLKPKAMATCIK